MCHPARNHCRPHPHRLPELNSSRAAGTLAALPAVCRRHLPRGRSEGIIQRLRHGDRIAAPLTHRRRQRHQRASSRRSPPQQQRGLVPRSLRSPARRLLGPLRRLRPAWQRRQPGVGADAIGDGGRGGRPRRQSGGNALGLLRWPARPPMSSFDMDIHEPRITGPTLKVLGTLLGSTRDELSGAEIGRATKLGSGTLYPILNRLEHAGWVESRWETEDPRALGRPRRRFYRVTGLGAQRARSAVRDLELAFGRLAWA